MKRAVLFVAIGVSIQGGFLAGGCSDAAQTPVGAASAPVDGSWPPFFEPASERDEIKGQGIMASRLISLAALARWH